jgi:hypothetical protein
MSDLQCAARFVVVACPDAATGRALLNERVAAVYVAPLGAVRERPAAPPGSAGKWPPAAVGATEMAGVWGLRPQPMSRPVAVADLLRRAADALDVLRELADLHRGETVVVVGEGDPGHRVDVALDGDGGVVHEVSPGVAR